jgi:hypothetical protein
LSHADERQWLNPVPNQKHSVYSFAAYFFEYRKWQDRILAGVSTMLRVFLIFPSASRQMPV